MQLGLHKFDDGSHHFADIRTIEIDGLIWFVGNDVARTLGYKSPNDAIRSHCKLNGTRKYRLPTNGGEQELTLVNEANIYRLIVKSQLESAEKFEVWLFEEVLPSIRKKGFYGKIDRSALPNFLERYKDNYHKIDKNYFSVITEMYGRLYSALEAVGYVIPDKGLHQKKMMPDISVGICFSAYLKEKNEIYYKQVKKYTHSFPDGRQVEANMYPIEALHLFIRYLHEVWIPTKAYGYFKGKDDLALDYLPKLLSA
ncbi:BRO family protein [Mucilaginibacter oryzae]|uniref:BRO family protein n=1 Tax=Mucilaginibacter oryzae TaxID=468058 RepID=A0A316HED0_9SPHI|nr:BRO family protein [Mucilaginibacter oryzae]PWK78523.1 BRO family protein [Mucilaginibacter oryzae]